MSTKGFLLFQEDVGSARQEFYQGWGLFQRFNSMCVHILGAHWAYSFVTGNWRRPSKLALLIWIVYLTLTLGSKSGLLSLLMFIGAALYFSEKKVTLTKLAVPVMTVVASIAVMFYVFFGVEAFVLFLVRFISFADGPFYYFGFQNPLQVSFSYPLQQLMVALRLIPNLLEPSLGPAINLEQFEFDNELVGPNPQIFVESVAILGALYPLFYVLVGCLIVLLVSSARSVYSLCLYTMVAGPLLIDTQLAFSNVFNLMLALIFRLILGSKLLSLLSHKINASHYISRI
jgi:hypothetical protein